MRLIDAKDMSSTRAGERWRAGLALALGAGVLLVAAWMSTRGIATSVAPLLIAWQQFWARMFGTTVFEMGSAWVYFQPVVWLLGAAVAFLVGWTMILAGVNGLWRGPYDGGDGSTSG